EDGIRDWSVTGVQTCALPICAWHRLPARDYWCTLLSLVYAADHVDRCRRLAGRRSAEDGFGHRRAARAIGRTGAPQRQGNTERRSEERRVGKGGGCGEGAGL